MIIEKFAKHTAQQTPQESDILIQYMDNQGKTNQDCPLLIIPGLSENVEDYRTFLEEMQDERLMQLGLH